MENFPIFEEFDEYWRIFHKKSSEFWNLMDADRFFKKNCSKFVKFEGFWQNFLEKSSKAWNVKDSGKFFMENRPKFGKCDEFEFWRIFHGKLSKIRRILTNCSLKLSKIVTYVNFSWKIVRNSEKDDFCSNFSGLGCWVNGPLDNLWHVLRKPISEKLLQNHFLD